MTSHEIRIVLAPVEAKMFFDDHMIGDGHVDATEEQCAQEVREWIEANGPYDFIREWDMLTYNAEIWVGNTKVYEAT